VDPDPGGPKTCGPGSGAGPLDSGEDYSYYIFKSINFLCKFFKFLIVENLVLSETGCGLRIRQKAKKPCFFSPGIPVPLYTGDYS
jgi:hypothetical protein